MKLSVPNKVILIGASTGGPGQIQKIIQALPELKNTSIVIAQHMIDGFMNSFANRFQNFNNKIIVIKDNQVFEKNYIYICEGETRLIKNYFSQRNSSLNSYNPNINIIFNSVNLLAKDIQVLCIILTGIGDDGVEACRNLSLNGVRCLTESMDSAIVDGMPNRARELVPNIEIYKIEDIVKIVSEFCE